MKKIKRTGAGGEIYSNKTADRLSNQWGVDVADELYKLISEQIAREIDKEILRGLRLEPEKNKRRKKSIYKVWGE